MGRCPTSACQRPQPSKDSPSTSRQGGDWKSPQGALLQCKLPHSCESSARLLDLLLHSDLHALLCEVYIMWCVKLIAG